MFEIKPEVGSKTFQQLKQVYRPKFDQWLRSFGLVARWETYEDCESPYIWHGYRPSPSSIFFCLKSAFYPSNELMNIWTHFIPLLLMIWRVYQIYISLEDPLDKITHPFWIQSFGICAVLFASTFAHLFCCHSIVGQELCFAFDYTVITVYGLATVIVSDHYLCPFRCYVYQLDSLPHFYIFIIFLINSISAYMTCKSRCPHRRMNCVTRYGPNTLCFIFTSLPCTIRFLFYGSSNDTVNIKNLPQVCQIKDSFEDYFLVHCIVFVIALVFVGSHIPERLYAGAFDIVGSSHQLFHVLVAVGMYLQHLMTESGMREVLKLRDEKYLDEESLHISLWSTFIPLFLFLLFVPLVVGSTVSNIGKIKQEKRKSI